MTKRLLFKTTPAKILLAFAALLLPQILLAQLDGPSLSSLTNRNQWRPLPLEQAFPLYFSEREAGHYRVVWNTAAEHYLYKHQFKFSLQQSPDSTPVAVKFEMPPGIEKTDEFFGEVEVYYNQHKVDLALPNEASDGAVLLIEFQGCAEWGFCYPPQKVSFELN